MKVIDLFCGAGGSTLGAKLARHKVIAAYDNDRNTLTSYQANHPDVPVYERDILNLNASDLPEGADIIIGSPPCESFSLINLHDRSNNTEPIKHFLKLVREYKPKFWVMENVPQVARFLNGVPYKMLCAANYGVPQKRKRCFAGNFPEPTQTHAEHPCGHLKPYVRFGRIMQTHRKKKPLSMNGLEGAYQRVWEMGRKKFPFKIYFVDKNRVLNTVTGSASHGLRAGSHIIYDNGILRNLTFLEVKRAMSFPDDYIFIGTQEKQNKQAGQAVPPLLMKAVLKGCR